MDGLPFLFKLCWTALVFSHQGNNLYFGKWELYCSKSRTRTWRTWVKPLGVWREMVRRLELLLAKVRPEALLSLHLWNPRPPSAQPPPTSSLPGVKMQESVQKLFCTCLNACKAGNIFHTNYCFSWIKEKQKFDTWAQFMIWLLINTMVMRDGKLNSWFYLWLFWWESIKACKRTLVRACAHFAVRTNCGNVKESAAGSWCFKDWNI